MTTESSNSVGCPTPLSVCRVQVTSVRAPRRWGAPTETDPDRTASPSLRYHRTTLWDLRQSGWGHSHIRRSPLEGHIPRQCREPICQYDVEVTLQPHLHYPPTAILQWLQSRSIRSTLLHGSRCRQARRSQPCRARSATCPCSMKKEEDAADCRRGLVFCKSGILSLHISFWKLWIQAIPYLDVRGTCKLFGSKLRTNDWDVCLFCRMRNFCCVRRLGWFMLWSWHPSETSVVTVGRPLSCLGHRVLSHHPPCIGHALPLRLSHYPLQV